MLSQLEFILNRLRERLWFRPLIACVVSVAGVLLAHLADRVGEGWDVPEIAQSSVAEMLKIIAASMLGVATFAVASMVSAYASTGESATARAFPLIVADDVSQNALSTFVGAFIFSFIGLSATNIDYYGKAGRFTLFVLVLLVLVIVVLVFVRWVDRIARLGRLGAVMGRVEHATAQALERRKTRPCMGGMVAGGPPAGAAFYATRVGLLQRVRVEALQQVAAKARVRITVAALPGAVIVPTTPLGYVLPDPGESGPVDLDRLRDAFDIGPTRHFDEDPGFGLVVLSEIACRALSPAMNDAGTAIEILGALERLLLEFARPAQVQPTRCDRVLVSPLSASDLFNDAFGAIARDGAGVIEVALRLQRVLGELGRNGDHETRNAARHEAALALARSEQALDFGPDLVQVRRCHADYWEKAAG